MSRKTKKEKLKARQRRLESLALKGSEAAPSGLVKREFSFSLKDLQVRKVEAKIPKKRENSLHFSDTTTLARDLIKTAIFAASVFALEIVIYLAWFKT